MRIKMTCRLGSLTLNNLQNDDNYIDSINISTYIFIPNIYVIHIFTYTFNIL